MFSLKLVNTGYVSIISRDKDAVSSANTSGNVDGSGVNLFADSATVNSDFDKPLCIVFLLFAFFPFSLNQPALINEALCITVARHASYCFCLPPLSLFL